MSDAYTFYFEDIFSSYDEWKDYFSSLNIINYDNAEEASFDEYCYNILSREFSGQNIRYSVPQAFLNKLANIYLDRFNRFKKEKEIIDSTYSLTPDELALFNEALVNQADNPDNMPNDPYAPLNYISTQSYTKINSNRLTAYIDALNKIPSLNIYNFINAKDNFEMSFKDLFMNVQVNRIPIYKIKEGE